MMIAQELSALLGGQMVNPNRDNSMVRCPFHDDRTASLSISIRKNGWYCFGCGRGGSIGTLALMLDGSVNDADLAMMLTRSEPDEEDERVDFTDLYNSFDHDNEVIDAYLASKQLLMQPVDYHFGLRTKGDLLAMPCFDGERVAAIKYRGPNGEKRYEKGGERIIYNVNDVRGKERVVLAEGESDTHALWAKLRKSDIGVGGVPGAMSSRETWELWALDTLWATVVYLAFDNDDAGEAGAERAIEVLGDKAKRLAPPAEYNDWADALMHGENVTL